MIELEEQLFLSHDIEAKSNPKSSIGRIDTHVRLLTGGGKFYDRIRSGYDKGKIFLEVIPHSFNILVKEGDCLNQVRFKDVSDNWLTNRELQYIHEYTDGILLDKKDKKLSIDNLVENDSLALTLELPRKNAGYEARKNSPPVDLSKRNLPFSEYFEEVRVSNDGIIIDGNSFYLLCSSEIVKIPEDHCAEMVDIRTYMGEYRAHYAGFFDPGFNGQAVLEVRNYSPVPFILKRNKQITSLVFNKVKSKQKYHGSYQEQRGIKAAKFFDMDK